jgi:hypothetical protein
VTKRHYVYRLTHVPTGRWYVGIRSCACDPSADPYLGSGKALKALPREELSKRVLVIVETREEAARIEAQLVGSSEIADPMCLNLIAGGGAKAEKSQSTRALLREASLSLWQDPDYRRRALHAIRAPERRARISQALAGRTFTDEARARMSAAQRLRYEDPEERRKAAARQLNRRRR